MKTFCITLRTTPERTKYVVEHLYSHGVTANMFYGIDNRQLQLIPANKYNIPEYGGEGMLNAGQVGCALSHYLLWNQLIDDSEDEFMIFEDDVSLIPGFLQLVEAYKKCLPEDWDYVLLGYEGLEKFPLKQLNEHVIESSPYCSFAYLIKKSSIPKLMNVLHPLTFPIDMQIPMDKGIRMYVLHPALAYQKSISSAIGWRTFKSLTV